MLGDVPRVAPRELLMRQHSDICWFLCAGKSVRYRAAPTNAVRERMARALPGMFRTSAGCVSGSFLPSCMLYGESDPLPYYTDGERLYCVPFPVKRTCKLCRFQMVFGHDVTNCCTLQDRVIVCFFWSVRL